MPLLPPTFIGSLDPTNPRGTDSRTISDDYHRMIQESVRMTLPNLTGAVTSTHQDLNLLSGLAAGGAKLMTGNGGSTVGLFLQATAPIGWTIITGFDGRSVIVKGTIGGGTVAGGAVGGSDDPGLMDKVPSHQHGVSAVSVASASAGDFNVMYGVTSGATRGALGDAGQGAYPDPTHTHSLSGQVDANTGAANWTPRYAAAIACQLDA